MYCPRMGATVATWRAHILQRRQGGSVETLSWMASSKPWFAFMLAAPVVGILAYCANHYLFDGRNDWLRRATAIGIACGVGALFLWVHIAVLDMARGGIVPIPPGRYLGLVSHHAFRYEDTPILFWTWLVLDVFVVTAFWLGAIIAGTRAAFGPSPEQRARDRNPILAARSKDAPSAAGTPRRPFPLNIPGACIGISEILSVVWVHAGLLG